MDETVKKLNNLAIEQLQLFSTFIQVTKQLESVLDKYRYNFSKTKSILGLPITSALFWVNSYMEPSVRIVIHEDGVFEIDSSSLDESNSPIFKTTFRPFGILEPQSARAARKNITNALPLICELASVKRELIFKENKYKMFREKVKE